MIEIDTFKSSNKYYDFKDDINKSETDIIINW